MLVTTVIVVTVTIFLVVAVPEKGVGALLDMGGKEEAVVLEAVDVVAVPAGEDAVNRIFAKGLLLFDTGSVCLEDSAPEKDVGTSSEI